MKQRMINAIRCATIAIILTLSFIVSSCSSDQHTFRVAYNEGAYTVEYQVLENDTCAIVTVEGKLPENYTVPSEVKYRSHVYAVTEIRAFAFSYWDADCNQYMFDAVKEISIPDTVEIIEASAFTTARDLESVYIGAGVHRMDADAFAEAPRLSEIVVSLENGHYRDIDKKCLTNADGTVLIMGTSSGYIPSGITEIAENAFCNRRFDSDSVVIPSGVVLVHDYAFSYVENLQKILIMNHASNIQVSDKIVYSPVTDAVWQTPELVYCPPD